MRPTHSLEVEEEHMSAATKIKSKKGEKRLAGKKDRRLSLSDTPFRRDSRR